MMTNPNLLNETDLKEWLGTKRRHLIEQYLSNKGVKFMHGRDGSICTTVQAVNDAIVGNPRDDDEFL